MKDEIFKTREQKPFEFDESVASVFDDMITRSVPFYGVSCDLICEILSSLLPQNAKVSDLGCSTAKMLLQLHEKRHDLELLGIDNSEHMLKIAAAKASAFGADIKFILDDILKCDFSGSDGVILNYVLQFIRPPLRPNFVSKIYHSLKENGIFIFSEKLVYDDKSIGKTLIDIHEKYKALQGYSRYEISQKREALENVLIPYTEEENKKMVLQSGFKSVETIFKWANFAVFIAIK